ncbi:hypothetical protein FB451DRAFT_1251816 [Mycena latifolia]|nr:hypothetical protein FB451DRAFT_1251816 [Mycena latifolia]
MPRRHILCCSRPSRLTGTCPEIILAIMKLSGPTDLKSLDSVCSLFKSILETNPSCWAYARERLSILPPPCGTIQWRSNESPLRMTPLIDRATSERAFIDYLFNGGKCKVCGMWSQNLPHSFAFNWRCCSASCRARVFSLHSERLVPMRTFDISQHPQTKWLVCHQTGSKRIYSKTELAGAKASIRDRCRGKPPPEQYYIKTSLAFFTECNIRTFNELESWKLQYLKAVKEMRDLNLMFLKSIAHRENRKLRNLLKCPTLHRVFEAFNRDLTRMGSNDWGVIENVVRREVKSC